jgi:hypothetical protein
MRKWEKRKGAIEFGSRTRRRPIKRDYDAARCGLRPIGAYACASVGSGKKGKRLLNSEVGPAVVLSCGTMARQDTAFDKLRRGKVGKNKTGLPNRERL